MIKPYYLFRIKRLIKTRENVFDLVQVLKEAKSILILCENNSADVMSFSNELKALLPGAKRNTWILNKLDEKLKLRNNGVKDSVIRDIRKKKYDVVIDLTKFNQLPWQFLVANINTKISVGVLNRDENGLFDLIVSPNKSSGNGDYNFLVEYIKKLVGF